MTKCLPMYYEYGEHIKWAGQNVLVTKYTMSQHNGDRNGSVVTSDTDFGLNIDEKCHCLSFNKKEFRSYIKNKK